MRAIVFIRSSALKFLNVVPKNLRVPVVVEPDRVNRGVLGATEQLWNAFHNASVAPKTPDREVDSLLAKSPVART
jgi:hypothetical protein